jgi:large subunit ribosomal protein L13
MKIIDGTGAVMGRLASYVAKEALKGEEFAVVNCDKVIITGRKKNIENEFFEKRNRFGSSQKGPKLSKTSEKMVKRTIRGMLPDHREGRGRIAWKNIKCYTGVPKEFEGQKMIKAGKEKRGKHSKVEEFTK